MPSVDRFVNDAIGRCCFESYGMDVLERILCAHPPFTHLPNGALSAFENVAGGVACRSDIPRGLTEPPRTGQGRSGLESSSLDGAYCLVFGFTTVLGNVCVFTPALQLAFTREIQPPWP